MSQSEFVWPKSLGLPMAWSLGIVDDLRRGWGAWLEAAGWGPVGTAWQEVQRVDGMCLRSYQERRPGPVLLIVPAPIKQAYIWDLAPGRSVVRAALARGFNVGLVQWTKPRGGNAAAYGLDDYADRLIRIAVETFSERNRSRALLLAGHSLGGTLAAAFAALHPKRVRGVVLIEAPLRFGRGAGALGSLAATAPWAPEAVRGAFEAVPGSFTSGLGVAADPVEFLTARWLDALASGSDPEALATHLRIVRWTLDEFAMPGRLFSDLTGRLCRDDEFFRGKLRVAGTRALPGQLRTPLLAVLDPRSALVPPRAVLPFLQRTGSPCTVLQHQERSAGVALRHLGALVGRDAQQYLWPRILRWLSAVWDGGPRAPGVSSDPS